jgi:hypothetical protein
MQITCIQVLIVWSEHSRPYAPNTIASDFGNVLICVYGMASSSEEKMYRVSVTTRPPSLAAVIGPLYDGVAVRADCLAALLR